MAAVTRKEFDKLRAEVAALQATLGASMRLSAILMTPPDRTIEHVLKAIEGPAKAIATQLYETGSPKDQAHAARVAVQIALLFASMRRAQLEIGGDPTRTIGNA